ncbi:MAG: helix-turn-helix domain-containing protein [Deltaproteobacteria bacterium]|nr:helix-turn-helix domain-containing protein [Deltaproteobacteria bacterium]
MKKFDGLNYYEILKIPMTSSYFEIKRAYKDALSLYNEDSIVTYSLFSKKERDKIIEDIENAFLTLSDDQKRAAYDQMLMDSGQVETFIPSMEKTYESPSQSAPHTGVNENLLHSRVKEKLLAEDVKAQLDEILLKERLSGDDLKKLRKAVGVKITEIQYITKISTSVLRAIEENRFEELPPDTYLKSFLRSYAKVLQTDPQKVIDGYFKTISHAKKTNDLDPT